MITKGTPNSGLQEFVNLRASGMMGETIQTTDSGLSASRDDSGPQNWQGPGDLLAHPFPGPSWAIGGSSDVKLWP